VSAAPKIVARTALVLFGALVLQLGMFDDLRVVGVHPEVLLAVGLGCAVAWGPERGAIVAFCAGLLTDMFLSGRFGVTGLAWGITGFGLGYLSDGIARRSMVIDAVLLGLGSAVGVMVYAVVAALFGEATLTDDHLWRIMGIVGISAAVISPVVLPLCRWTGADVGLRPSR